MTLKVEGFLAADKTFFTSEPECKRYEATKELEALCDSHGVNPENFMNLLNAWHEPIKGYYDADTKCETKQAGGRVQFEQGTFDDYDDDGDDIPAFLPVEGDHSDPPIRDKDAPGFLEQQVRGNIGVSDIRDRPHAETISPARKGHGPRSR